MEAKDLLDLDYIKKVDAYAVSKASKNPLSNKYKSFKNQRKLAKIEAGTIEKIVGRGENYWKPSPVIKKKKRGKRKYENRVPQQYKVYIESHHWTKRRNRYFKENGRACVVCGSAKYIQLHHMLYQNYGSEKDEHLVPLCETHHAEFHERIGKTQQNMIKATHNFIIEKQEEIEAYEMSKRF